MAFGHYLLGVAELNLKALQGFKSFSDSLPEQRLEW